MNKRKRNFGKTLLHLIRNKHYYYSIHRFTTLMRGVGLFKGSGSDMMRFLVNKGYLAKLGLNDYMPIPDEKKYFHTIYKHILFVTHTVSLTHGGFIHFTNLLNKELHEKKQSK